MRKLLLGVAWLAVCSSLSAQTTEQTFKVRSHGTVEKREFVRDEIDLGDNGYVFKTADHYTTFAEQTIYFFKPTGELLWTSKVKRDMKTYGIDDLIASPTGSIVYNVQHHKPLYSRVEQIMKTGAAKEFDPEKRFADFQILSIFCDDSYLYYFADDAAFSDRIDKPRDDQKAILHRFSHANMDYKKIELKLPAVMVNRQSTFWTYIGQYGDQKFLYCKAYDEASETINVQLASFSSNGENIQIKTLTIPTTLAGCTMNYEATSLKSTAAFSTVGDPDVLRLTYAYVKKTRHVKAYIDVAHGALYITNLFNKNESKSEEAFMMIRKYSLSGDLLWEAKTPGFQTHFLFKVLPDETINVTYATATQTALVEISPNGKNSEMAVLEFPKKVIFPYARAISGLDHGAVPASFSYINKLPEKERGKNYFTNSISSEGEILTSADLDGTLRVLFFKK